MDFPMQTVSQSGYIRLAPCIYSLPLGGGSGEKRVLSELDSTKAKIQRLENEVTELKNNRKTRNVVKNYVTHNIQTNTYNIINMYIAYGGGRPYGLDMTKLGTLSTIDASGISLDLLRSPSELGIQPAKHLSQLMNILMNNPSKPFNHCVTWEDKQYQALLVRVGDKVVNRYAIFNCDVFVKITEKLCDNTINILSLNPGHYDLASKLDAFTMFSKDLRQSEMLMPSLIGGRGSPVWDVNYVDDQHVKYNFM